MLKLALALLLLIPTPSWAGITSTNTDPTPQGTITVLPVTNQTTVSGSPVGLGGTVTVGTVQDIAPASSPIWQTATFSLLVGSGNRCAYVDSLGILHAHADDCGASSPTGDNLGDHIQLQNLQSSGWWYSRAGADDGIYLDASSPTRVGIGTNAPATKVHVLATNGAGDGIVIEGSAANPRPSLWLQSHGATVSREWNVKVAGHQQGQFLVNDSTGGTDPFVITVDGRIGLGHKIDPSYTIHALAHTLDGDGFFIEGSAANPNPSLYLKSTGAAVERTWDLSARGADGSFALIDSTAAATRIGVSTGGVITFGVYGLGVLHSSAAGLLTSSLISNADLTNSSITIAGTTDQVAVAGGGPVALGGTATLSIPSAFIAPGTITATGLLTVNGSGVSNFTGSLNGQQGIVVTNNTSGTVAYSTIHLATTTSDALFQLFSAGFTTSGVNFADGVNIQSTGAGGTSLTVSNAAGALRIYTGGTTRRANISAAGVVTFDTYGTGLLHSSAAGVLTSSLVSLTADVSGILPRLNGGWGSDVSGPGATGVVSFNSGTPIFNGAITAGRLFYGAAGNTVASSADLGFAGTTLTVGGLIESTSGGFKFPDASIQTTAVTQTPYVCTSGVVGHVAYWSSAAGTPCGFKKVDNATAWTWDDALSRQTQTVTNTGPSWDNSRPLTVEATTSGARVRSTAAGTVHSNVVPGLLVHNADSSTSVSTQYGDNNSITAFVHVEEQPAFTGVGLGFASYYEIGVTVTGNTHSNTTVDGISPNTTGMAAGQAIGGAGIPAGTTIASVTGANSLTLSASATVTASGVTLGVGSNSSSERAGIFGGTIVHGMGNGSPYGVNSFLGIPATVSSINFPIGTLTELNCGIPSCATKVHGYLAQNINTIGQTTPAASAYTVIARTGTFGGFTDGEAWVDAFRLTTSGDGGLAGARMRIANNGQTTVGNSAPDTSYAYQIFGGVDGQVNGIGVQGAIKTGTGTSVSSLDTAAVSGQATLQSTTGSGGHVAAGDFISAKASGASASAQMFGVSVNITSAVTPDNATRHTAYDAHLRNLAAGGGANGGTAFLAASSNSLEWDFGFLYQTPGGLTNFAAASDGTVDARTGYRVATVPGANCPAGTVTANVVVVGGIVISC